MIRYVVLLDGLKSITNRVVQAINVVEAPAFRRLLLLLRGDLRDTDIPRRTKTRELILEAWLDHFLRLKRDLKVCPRRFAVASTASSDIPQRAVGQISFTADLWSSDNLNPYLAITAHWIGQEETSGGLHWYTALIAFHHFPARHTGDELAKTILSLIDRAEIAVTKVRAQFVSHLAIIHSNLKIGHFTLDNASNNDTAMAALAQLLEDERELPFDPDERRVRCFPHIINICVQHTLDSFTDADFTNVPTRWGNPPINKAEYVAAVRRDPVGLARDTVRAIRGSNQRRTNFEQTIISGNDNQSFIQDGVIVPLPVSQLVRDVRTRWDSSYLMIRRIRTLRQVSRDCV